MNSTHIDKFIYISIFFEIEQLIVLEGGCKGPHTRKVFTSHWWLNVVGFCCMHVLISLKLLMVLCCNVSCFHAKFEESASVLFVEAFINQLRVSRVIQLLGYHPKYLQCFLRTHNFLMRGDGPLPYPVRHYIAILVSC